VEQRPRISIVIGVQDGAANLPAILAVFETARFRDFEVLVCHGRDEAIAVAEHGAVRVITGPDGALIPQLWGVGIKAAHGDMVAMLSAHCIPALGWLDHVAGLDMVRCVAYGGVIDLPKAASAKTAAMHILRYASVTPPQLARVVDDIAADNAVYRRDEILACADLLEAGFWEPEFHHRFRQKGLRLEFDPALVADHANLYSARTFMRQRRTHGRVYGRDRAQGFGLGRRWLMLISAPLTFPVFLSKLVMRAWRSPVLRPRLLPSLFWLLVFTACWTFGEASGYLDALRKPRRVTILNGT